MSQNEIQEEPPEKPEESFEMTAEEATSFEKSAPAGESPGSFNRNRVLKLLCISFAVVVGGGLLFNVSRGNKKTAETPANERAARAPSDFLARQLERARRRPETDPSGTGPPDEIPVSVEEDSPAAVLVRPVSLAPVPAAPPAPSRPLPADDYGGRTVDPLALAYISPLVPVVQGSLFNGNAPAGNGAVQPAQAQQYQAAYPAAEYQRALEAAAQTAYPSPQTPQDPYALQNGRDNKQNFYPDDNARTDGGQFLGDTSLWIGTIIPAVLITAINTDLPGNTLARVTENIYDSKTGKNLLVPQGTILVARYNSSVSYAQHRVQIVWDTLIRPDGFQLELAGANGVDRKGMAGLEAVYHENWFEYLKAAGIITLFSVANSKMTEEAAKYASDSTAAGIAQANTEFVNEMGANIVSRTMNIQPTLTVDNGMVINIMLNRNISLPPVPGYPVARRYIR
jgi:type IV secretion system protein VirB10